MLREAWTLAIETLSWMQMQKLSERLALAKTVRQLGTQDGDAVRLAHLLVCETVRRQNLIDKFVNSALRPERISELDLGLQAFLRLYVYQTRIAKNWFKIDVKEAEKIARLARSILGWKSLQQVEPVLGMLLTQKPKVVFENTSDEERVGLLTFHPIGFVKYCFNLFGRMNAIALLEADSQKPPTYIRLNTLKSSESEILAKLAGEGIKGEKVEQLKYVYIIIDAEVPLTKTESFQEGLFYVQDKASCFAAEAANPQPEMVILDVCAAPGAKTTYLAQLMQNRGSIYSVDYSKRRMHQWRSEVTRMGVEIAEPMLADGRRTFPFNLEADVVVLDPPCTGTGSFRKVPSAKWRLTPRSIDRMADIQWQMLNNCAKSVKDGGFLIYSTCSITVEENEMQIEKFLKWNTEFSLIEVGPRIGLPGLRTLEKCQRLYPNLHHCNGFFIAKLRRN
ncbi:MAG: RsmB/NOP family class I SAM-dependent RNA methyltransferase [Candidatus Bathyarchaeia archaeon]